MYKANSLITLGQMVRSQRVAKACLAGVVVMTMYMMHETISGESSLDAYSLLGNSHRSLTESGDASASSQNRMHHKPLFPMDWADIWGTVLVSMGSMIAASGGIGGGSILVPLLILIFDFHPKYAIPLSNFTIVGSSITNMIMNLPKRHPTEDRPLVDWDLILVMEPLTMVGAIVGAFLSKILSDQILSVSLVILLAFTTKTTLEKGMSLWHKESETFEREARGAIALALEVDVEMTQQQSLISSGGSDDELDTGDIGDDSNLSGDGDDADDSGSVGIQVDIVTDPRALPAPVGGGGSSSRHPQSPSPGSSPTAGLSDLDSIARSPIDKMLDEIGTQFEDDVNDASSRRLLALSEDAALRSMLTAEAETPQLKLQVISGMVLAVILLNLLKGGKKGVFESPLGIECGSGAYWFVQLSVLALVLCVSYWARESLITNWRKKARLGYKYAAGDVEWNETNTIKYPCYCFFAGLFAGMFGVGGGIVKGPLMLYMGVNPLVASATVAVMIMFTSVAATAMFMAFGTLQWDYAWFLFFVGLVTTAVGQFGVSYLVQKYRRVSLVSLSIGAVVAISTLLMVVQTMVSMAEVDNAASSTADNTVCS